MKIVDILTNGERCACGKQSENHHAMVYYGFRGFCMISNDSLQCRIRRGIFVNAPATSHDTDHHHTTTTPPHLSHYTPPPHHHTSATTTPPHLHHTITPPPHHHTSTTPPHLHHTTTPPPHHHTSTTTHTVHWPPSLPLSCLCHTNLSVCAPTASLTPYNLRRNIPMINKQPNNSRLLQGMSSHNGDNLYEDIGEYNMN